MCPSRTLAGGLAALVLVLGLAPLPADEAPAAPSPLRYVPAEADLVIQIRSPVEVARAIRSLSLLEALPNFPVVREQLNSTNARRGKQLLAYLEKEMGAA